MGAGPGGASAAYHLARLGRRVLLLDRARFPRDKSCGDGLTRSAVRLLGEMGVLERLTGTWRIGGTRVFMRGKGHRDFSYPKGLTSPDHGLVVPRYRLDHVLRERAREAGAELWDRALVTRCLRGDGVAGVEVQRQGEAERVDAPVVVLAAGAASRLGAEVGLTKPADSGLGFAIRGYYSGVAGLGERLEIYMPLTDPTDRYVLPSYGWVFPTGASTANIGVGIFERGHGVSIRALMQGFLDDLRARDPRFAGMTPLGRWIGAPLNFAFQPETCSVPGVVLVGDAAGLISPFTGEGISYAIESGRLAADAIHRNLTTDGVSPDLSDYPLMLEKRYAGYFEAGRESARRYRLFWHVLESTFHDDKPLFALCRRAALYPEGIGETNPSRILDDVGALIDRGGLNVREDLLATGEILLHAVRRDWPFLARLSTSGHGDPGVPFRPALLLLLAGAVLPRSTDRERLLLAAAALELGYMAALAHLSVDDEPGRGQAEPRTRPAHWGNMLAVMVGDFLLSRAYELSARVSSEVSRAIADALAIGSEGQLREQRVALSPELSHPAWLEIASLKMATLFEAPCRIGAALGGLTAAQCEALRQYGRNLGLAFILTDQILGPRGKASELGKLMISETSRGGAREEEVAAEAKEYSRRAHAALESVPVGPAQRTLRRLATYAVDRDIAAGVDLKSLVL